jgi:hypothetical protein
MVHVGVTIGGSHAVTAVLGGFSGGASVQTQAPAPVVAPPVAAPDGKDLFIERHKGNVIEIVDKPLVYRTYVHGVPSRAITVGLPNKVSYAFDADACRLVFAWKGGFLDVEKSWTGFGGWYSKLLGEKFYEAPDGFPLRIGDPAKEPTVRFRGYDVVNDLPIFKYLVDGQRVHHKVTVSEDDESISHEFNLPDNAKPVFFVATDGNTRFKSADAAWEDGRWSVASGKRQQFTMGVVR